MLILFMLTPSLVLSEPHIPERDDLVLETLPDAVFSRNSDLTRLRRNLAQKPEDVNLATALADEYIRLGNESGDPRYYGYAQAALRPWWEQESPSAKVLQQRAKLQEKQHDYEAALIDLKRLLANDPGNAQAWINVSNIYRVQGEYDQALDACRPLQELRGSIISTFCVTPIRSLTGHARESYQTLQSLLPGVREKSAAFYHWTLTTMAEIAVMLGLDEEAESHFSEAYSQDSEDFYLIRGYADFLLDNNRPVEALELTKGYTNDNGILLRAAIAAKLSNKNKLVERYSRLLRSRFDEIRLRGGTPHGRYESRYELVFGDDPDYALQVAETNWQNQKELRDTRNLLQAALDAGQPQVAKPAIDFLRQNRTEDVTLLKLIDQLEARNRP